ncbi:hypothetical protein ACFOLJ_20110 [Rugamonas sp. CCM 8940]|uniref:hypothetical protein n=1 Tax=Rugamonas sp. CCM 8940 TaxID=2765359 RepID=UPI0018F767E1|nr:hypothetical protein [Rugamonas sp. CCM 8940]MBJ7313872.1 hypothetical protein [Rugamonas sp. CCM 8940]
MIILKTLIVGSIGGLVGWYVADHSHANGLMAFKYLFIGNVAALIGVLIKRKVGKK